MAEIVLRQSLPSFIERNIAQNLDLPTFELNGSIAGGAVPKVPDGPGTFQLLDPSGEALFSPAKATTVVAGRASVALVAADLDEDSSDRYVELWVIPFDGTNETFRREAILAKYVPRQTITDDDLNRILPRLSELLPDDQSSWEPQRTEAWVQINARLIAKGNRVNLIISTWALRNLQLYWTLFLIAELMLAEGDGGRWPKLLEKFEKRVAAEWDGLSFEYDEDDDDVPDTRQSASPTVMLGDIPDDWGPASVGVGWRDRG